jgi:hypothetical protein
MNISDCDFLLWLAKRLLYKHKDDAKISAKLEHIAKALSSQLRSFELISTKDYSEIDQLLK